MFILRRFVLALQFLTIATVWPGLRAQDRDLAGSMLFYPLIGLGLGAAYAGAWLFLGRVWPPLLIDAVVVALGVILTRGLHLEGLADTADGLAGGMGTDRALEIMKDHNSGSFALMAVSLLLLLKFVALMAMRPEIKLQALILMPVMARAGMVVLTHGVDYARPQGQPGLARSFVADLGLVEVGGAWLTALIVGVLVMGSKGALLLIGATALAWIFKLYLKRRLGGVTGDTIGCLGELTELGVLLAFAGW